MEPDDEFRAVRDAVEPTKRGTEVELDLTEILDPNNHHVELKLTDKRSWI